MNSKIETYQSILLGLLEDEAKYVPVNMKTVENEIVVDKERNHFQLLMLGWADDNKFFHNTVFHFDIKPDGKIWIQVNRTDIDIAAELVERGVEKTDIVIGFQPHITVNIPATPLPESLLISDTDGRGRR